jgi:hypothetical protein
VNEAFAPRRQRRRPDVVHDPHEIGLIDHACIHLRIVGQRPADAIGLHGLHSRNGDGEARNAANSSA